MEYHPISFKEKFAKFSDQFAPKVVAQMNDYQFKLVRVEGDFIWHSHPETDETFIVFDGELTIDFRDGAVALGPRRMLCGSDVWRLLSSAPIVIVVTATACFRHDSIPTAEQVISDLAARTTW